MSSLLLHPLPMFPYYYIFIPQIKIMYKYVLLTGVYNYYFTLYGLLILNCKIYILILILLKLHHIFKYLSIL